MSTADSPTKICTTEGCERPLRARGVCASHYNKQYSGPALLYSITCEVCQKTHATPRKSGRFCSLECREVWRRTTPGREPWNKTTCPLPHNHPAMVLLARMQARQVADARAAQRWDLWAKRMATAAAMRSRKCGECEAYFHPRTTIQKYCGRKCLRRVHKRIRKAREHGAGGTYSWPEVMRLFLAFARCCAYCEKLIAGQPDPDHVVPLSKGGSNSITNILPSCRACNGDKRDLLLHEWNADRARRGLPLRRTSWDEDDRRVWHITSVRLSRTVPAA